MGSSQLEITVLPTPDSFGNLDLLDFFSKLLLFKNYKGGGKKE
jgi:hypothetical protein